MRSLVVTTPATDKTLLTLAEMRALAGVSDSSRDDELRALEARVAASIAAECNVAVGIGAEPTLRRETLTETIYCPRSPEFFLSRRHNVSVSSIVNDNTTEIVTDYLINPESGGMIRLQAGFPSIYWYSRVIVVVYDAGFETVPGDLKQAAMDFVRATLAEAERDPFVKSESRDVAGVGSKSVDYWVGSIPGQSHEGAVPDIVAGQLKRFRNLVFG